MSLTTDIQENLARFIEINNERLHAGKPTICRNEKGEISRKNLPCDKRTKAGAYIIQCENCCFFSVEAGAETIKQIREKIIPRRKIMDILLGIKDE
jgi:hypothetical protein